MSGLLLQFIVALLILRVPFIQFTLEHVSKAYVKLLSFSKEGSRFLFGDLVDQKKYGIIFAFQVLPTIIFFSALTSVLYYYHIIPKIVGAIAWVLKKVIRLSGAESLVTAGNIFVGQIEAPIFAKAYLPTMTASELFLVMTSGLATIAGSVLLFYISFLGGEDPVQQVFFAKHLLTASVMAAPGAIVVAKIIKPQTKNFKEKAEPEKIKAGSNILDAISNGTIQGVKLVVHVGAMLIVFLALIKMVNFIIGQIGEWTALNRVIDDITNGAYQKLSLQFIMGYLFYPIIWAIGVCPEDITLVGQLLGEKIITNEFISYLHLADLKESGSFVQEKSIIIATYMLCGFANFGSVGMQIGGIGALAPNKRAQLAKMGIKALVGGTLASLLSATIIAIIL